MGRELRRWAGTRVALWQPEEGDAFLYALSALFAGLTIRFSDISLYRQWAELALAPYLVAGLLSAIIGRIRAVQAGAAAEAGDAPAGPAPRHWRPARIWIFVFVLVGATLVPLSLEVAWRSDSTDPSAHVQPEVYVIEQAGHRAAHGLDPYREVTSPRGQIKVTTPGIPTYENFFPYLPLMGVFGLPSAAREPIRLTDARIFFSGFTLLVVAGALALCRGPSERRVRTLQVLTVLPTAALPLATGGDDMPIVALLLLAIVLAQRRRPVLSGFVLGVASAMKFTAWPLAALALFAARDKQGKRAPVPMALGMLVVAGPVVLPFILRGPFAFFDNVILFPLGLSGVSSPAASPLLGHVLVDAFPSLHRVLPVTIGLVGGAALVIHLFRRPPKTAAQVTSLAGWVMLVAIIFAPATRIGYLLYPINFFVWSALLRGEDQHDVELSAALLGDDEVSREGRELASER